MTPSERPARNAHPASAYARRKGLSGYGGGAGRARRKAPFVRGTDPHSRWTARGMSLGLHALVAALLLAVGPLQPPPREEARKPVTVVEVEFVDAPAPRSAKATAPAPAAKAPQPPAPIRPAPRPRPEAAARPKPAAQRVARRMPVQPPKPAPKSGDLAQPQQASPQDLSRKLEARLSSRREREAQRAAELAGGLNRPQQQQPPGSGVGKPYVTTGRMVGDISGRIAARVDPVYPQSAKDNQREGTVVVRLLVDRNGSVLSAEIVEHAMGSDLDAAARAAALSFRFHPLPAGESEIQAGTIPFRFVKP